ncbi:MAG TPA: hypothetical protein VMW95_00745 [Desulfobacterales bacterium]|nr:hypothetical protein [Desulfobacterales bacterium]
MEEQNIKDLEIRIKNSCLTADITIDAHRYEWEWLKAHPGNTKDDHFYEERYSYQQTDGITPFSLCFLCHFALQLGHKEANLKIDFLVEDNNRCKFCIGKWRHHDTGEKLQDGTKALKCGLHGSPYYMWVNSDSVKERTIMAKKVAEIETLDISEIRSSFLTPDIKPFYFYRLGETLQKIPCRNLNDIWIIVSPMKDCVSLIEQKTGMYYKPFQPAAQCNDLNTEKNGVHLVTAPAPMTISTDANGASYVLRSDFHKAFGGNWQTSVPF